MLCKPSDSAFEYNTSRRTYSTWRYKHLISICTEILGEQKIGGEGVRVQADKTYIMVVERVKGQEVDGNQDGNGTSTSGSNDGGDNSGEAISLLSTSGGSSSETSSLPSTSGSNNEGDGTSGVSSETGGSLLRSSSREVAVDIPLKKPPSHDKGENTYRDQTWVIDFIEERTGRVFTQVIENKLTPTFEEIIHNHLLPGTVLVTDGLASYESAAREVNDKYKMRIVLNNYNKSKEGHVAASGDTTNLIENYWHRIKSHVNMRKVVRADKVSLF